MDDSTWVLGYLIGGGLLILMALASSLVRRLPLTTDHLVHKHYVPRGLLSPHPRFHFW